jgi:predicted transcriptional regulator
MKETLIGLTADIVAAHVSNNNVSVNEVAGIIRNVHDALSGLAAPAPVEAPKAEPAVSIRASVKPDYIVCLEDGAKLKMLKRYLRTRFDMSPEDYRAKWGLPKDYPMVAPNYAEMRRGLAVKIGLGKAGKSAPKAAAAKPAAEKPASAKPPVAEAAAAAPAPVRKAPAKPRAEKPAKAAAADAKAEPAAKKAPRAAKAAKPAGTPATDAPKPARGRKPKATTEAAS